MNTHTLSDYLYPFPFIFLSLTLASLAQLIIFTTDNGGPAQGFNSNMASNWPLRGMKRTLWQGGVRGTAFIAGAGIDESQQGSISNGLMHVTDWFPTVLAAAQGKVNGAVDGEAKPADGAAGGEAWKSLMEFGGGDGSGDGSDPPFQTGDGVNVWSMLSTGSASPRTEVIIEAHPTSTFSQSPDGVKGTRMSPGDDGNGQAIIVGDLKLIWEKGPEWHGPPNDLWYDSGSNPGRYAHTVKCVQPPPVNASDFCDGSRLPCLFNITADPCEYV